MANSVYDGLVGTQFSAEGQGPAAWNCGTLVLEVLRRAGLSLACPPFEADRLSRSSRCILDEIQDEDWLPVAPPYHEFDLIVFRDEKHDASVHCGTFVPPDRVLHTTRETGCACEPLRRYKSLIQGVYRHRCLK